MSIADPETDINLWITVVSQSIPLPEQLLNYQKQIEQVFSDVFEEENTLNLKYQISADNFYYSVYTHILKPLLQLNHIQNSDEFDSFSLISDILINFLKLAYLFLYREDVNIREMLLLLFQRDNELYAFNPSFYSTICENFIDFGYFNNFLNYIEKISEMPQTLNSVQSNPDPNTADQITDFNIKMKKLPVIAKIEMQLIPFINENKDFDFKTFCNKLTKPLLLFPKFSNDSFSYYLFIMILDQMNNTKFFDPEIIKFWLEIFQTYLLTGSFSLILFSIRAMSKLIQTDFFNETLFNFLREEEYHKLVNLYLKVEIRHEFADFLKVIYSSFLKNKIIDFEDLLPIWETRKTNHVSVRAAFFSIFEEASQSVPDESIEKFTKMALTNIQLNKEWLIFIVNCATNLSQRGVDVSEYKNILTKVNQLDFDFNSETTIDENEISSYQEIAENGLTNLLIGSLNSNSYSSFLEMISDRIKSGKETGKDIEILYQSLTKFSKIKTDLTQQFCQQFLGQIISIFDRHNIYLMMNIVRLLVSDSYGCIFEQSYIKKLLSLSSNEKICSNVFSFITELCLALNQISIDDLLQEMVSGNYTVNKSFYRTIKSIILNINNGYFGIDHFPFIKEEVIWFFCYTSNRQILRFQHFLSRIYLKSKASDEEMIQSFLTNWANGFKKFYHNKQDDNTIEQFFDFLEIFLKKIEYYIYTPIQYHFSQYKTNKIQIRIEYINDDRDSDDFPKLFYFDQRRSISSLIEYIRHQFKIDEDLEIYYHDRYLNKRISFAAEIGSDDLDRFKIENKPVFISIKRVQKNSNIKTVRTIYPSRFIIDNMNGLIDILFKYSKYHSILYKLPTFNETLIKIKNLTKDDFQSFFPYNNINKFRYNFESFLDFYSMKQFDLLSDELIEYKSTDLIFQNSFVKSSGIIDYFISCGLSITDETLLNMILSFLRDFASFNPQVLDNEILNEQLLSMIQQYIEDPKSISNTTITTIFTFKLKSIANLTKEQLYQLLIMNNSYEIREGAREFLREIYIPLSYYSWAYNESQYEPKNMFYFSWADHILLSKEKDNKTNSTILINLRKTNPDKQYLCCIDAALKKDMFNESDINTIANYIATNFIQQQINMPPKSAFNFAISIASYLKNDSIDKAFIDLLNSVDNFDLLADYLFSDYEEYDEYPVFNGDNLFLRQYNSGFYSISVDCIQYPIGLKNLGATCYLNVIIQQLFNITDFRNELNSKPISEEDDRSKLILSLNELFIELENTYLGVVNPNHFVELFGADKKIHCDCCEFFLQLIDRLGIDDLFKCKFKHTISAIDDENLKVESFEDFFVLPLSIRGISNIDESLDHLFEIDYFTGDNGYIFEDGKGKVDASKSCSIHSLSDHLIIQLERFEYNHQTQEREKITSFFEFGEYLEINDKRFILTGVIIHLGESAESGHYISYIRKPKVKAKEEDGDEKYFSNDWYKYNDSTVTSATQEAVFEDGYENGYILFYTERDSDILDPVDNRKITQLNKEVSVCRMLFSNSMFDSMIEFLNNQNRFNLAAIYFFKFLHFYDNQKYQETFGSTFLSLLQNSKESDDYLLKTIVDVWRNVHFENPLLYSKWRCMRYYTCEILKEIVSSVDCFEQLTTLMVNCIPHLYNFFYSSNKFFEIVNFALQKFPEKMTQIMNENEIYNKLVSLFVKICVNRTSIEFQCTELNYFFQIFCTIGLNDKIEDAIINNHEVIEDFFNSNTSADDVTNLILKMKRKEEIVSLFGENEELSDKMMILLSQI